jgi:hypothetical protein
MSDPIGLTVAPTAEFANSILTPLRVAEAAGKGE